jgi:hypothetical protein
VRDSIVTACDDLRELPPPQQRAEGGGAAIQRS